MSEKIPQVIFTYAYPLDVNRRQLFEIKDFDQEYPSSDEVRKELASWRELWKKLNKHNRVLERITELTGVNYPRDIEAFVFGGGLGAMSTPLLLPLLKLKGKPEEKRKELIIHEILHLYVSIKTDKVTTKPYWDMIAQKYANESKRTQNHIIIYALLEKLLAEFVPDFDVKNAIHPEAEDYFRALKIARQADAGAVIAEFREFVSKS